MPKVNFLALTPPPTRTIRWTATEPSNGASMDIELRTMTLLEEGASTALASRMIRKYVPLKDRAPEFYFEKDVVEDFPAGPSTGYITLDQNTAWSCANFVYSQSAEDPAERYTFEDFVYCARTAPSVWLAGHEALQKLHQIEDDGTGKASETGTSDSSTPVLIEDSPITL